MSAPPVLPARAPRVRLRAPLLSQTIGHRGEVGLLLGLGVAGFALRAAGISFGLPDHIVHDDTPKQLHRVAAFLNGELIPDDTYPTLHMYIVALVLKVLHLLDPHLYDLGPSMTQVAVSARLLNTLLSVGTLPLIYLLGKRLFDWRVGALAAALASLSALDVLHTHYEMGDILHTFFATASVLASVAVFRTGRASAYALAGLFAGLAASAKYYGAIVLVTLAVAALVGPSASWRRRLTLVGAAGLIAVAAFVLTTPKLLVTPVEFLEQLRHSPELFVLPPPPVLQRPIVAGKLLFGLSLDWFGPLVLALALLGMALALAIRRWPAGGLALTPPATVVSLYVATRANYLDDRNLVILAPFVYLTAGLALTWLLDRRSAVGAAGAAVGLVALAGALVSCLQVGYLFWQDDTRRFAERWLARHAPGATAVATGIYPDTPEGYATIDADLLLTTSQQYNRYVDWYSPLRSARVQRSLEFVATHGKLLQRFELLPRAFTAPTLSYYDLRTTTVPWVFPPPDDVARPTDVLIFLNPDAVPRPVGVFIERRRTATRTLVSRTPLRSLVVALSGSGHVRVRHGWRTVRATLTPGEVHVVQIRPRRGFPWFKYFYRLQVEARDGWVYARIVTSPCDLAQVHLAYGQWRAAIIALEECQGTRWVEPSRLLDLAWAHAELGDGPAARDSLEALERRAPGLLESLAALAGEPDGPAWRERYRSIVGQPPWFWKSHLFTIQAEDAPEWMGTVAPAADAGADRVVRFEPGRTPPGYLKVWFPHEFLRGRYLVRFRLRGTGHPGHPIATLSVVRHFQRRLHDVPASRGWTGSAADSPFADFVLPVTVDLEPMRLEARVFYHGQGALEVDEISILTDVRSALITKLAALSGFRPARPAVPTPPHRRPGPPTWAPGEPG